MSTPFQLLQIIMSKAVNDDKTTLKDARAQTSLSFYMSEYKNHEYAQEMIKLLLDKSVMTQIYEMNLKSIKHLQKTPYRDMMNEYNEALLQFSNTIKKLQDKLQHIQVDLTEEQQQKLDNLKLTENKLQTSIDALPLELTELKQKMISEQEKIKSAKDRILNNKGSYEYKYIENILKDNLSKLQQMEPLKFDKMHPSLVKFIKHNSESIDYKDNAIIIKVQSISDNAINNFTVEYDFNIPTLQLYLKKKGSCWTSKLCTIMSFFEYDNFVIKDDKSCYINKIGFVYKPDMKPRYYQLSNCTDYVDDFDKLN